MRKLRLANDEDISLLQKTSRPTQFLAKDHPEVQQLLDIQLDREETRSQKVEEAMKGVYDGLKNLSKAQHRNLTALLHKLDGKKLNAITEERFVKRTLPNGDWEYSGLNDAHYEQLRDFFTQHNTFKGVNGENVSLDGKTVDVFITIRRMLDNNQLGLYNHLRESKLPKNVIDTYRSSMGSVHNYFPHGHAVRKNASHSHHRGGGTPRRHRWRLHILHQQTESPSHYSDSAMGNGNALLFIYG